MGKNLYDLFSNKKILIGMIHLAGNSRESKIYRALEELTIYDKHGFDGVIIEDYHGTSDEVEEVLKESRSMKLNLVKGVNILRNPYSSFHLAQSFDAKFVQFDSVQTPDLDLDMYEQLREKYSEIHVLGGVRFKYTQDTGNSLERDLEESKSRCEAIVTTGVGTGIETPIEKLEKFRRLLGNFPLISGAGVNNQNVKEQLRVADGAIIGSYFKRGNTRNYIDEKRILDLMQEV